MPNLKYAALLLSSTERALVRREQTLAYLRHPLSVAKPRTIRTNTESAMRDLVWDEIVAYHPNFDILPEYSLPSGLFVDFALRENSVEVALVEVKVHETRGEGSMGWTSRESIMKDTRKLLGVARDVERYQLIVLFSDSIEKLSLWGERMASGEWPEKGPEGSPAHHLSTTPSTSQVLRLNGENSLCQIYVYPVLPPEK